MTRYWLTASLYANRGLAGFKHSRQPMGLDCATPAKHAPESYKRVTALDSRNNDLIIIARRKEFAPLLDKLQSDSNS
jgi:hypothetical protein